MPRRLYSCLLCALAAPAFGAGLAVDVEIPRLDTAEYHRPYVAVWIEHEDNRVAANVAVWYQQVRAQARPAQRAAVAQRGASAAAQGCGDSGTKWLPDLRQWWRRSGRSLALPVDGVTGATRPVGTHTIELDAASAPLDRLVPGNYRLVVEAVREVGGRELLRLPFVWPPTDAWQTDVRGTTELGRVAVRLTP